MKKYNKLVRDRIPEIIESGGNTCVAETMSDGEFLMKLDEKLGEELAEYLESHDIAELADMLEVIYACAEARGCTEEELDRLRAEKVKARGRFSKKLLLKEVSEPQ